MFDKLDNLSMGFVLFMNVVGFLMMGIDKYKAKKKLWRIPEKVLLLTALFGGAVGVYAGMLFFRHKTKHWYFVIGVPAILIAEIVIALFIFKN
ncbi:MAG TPA: DUF1294 domain-containing protein [Acetivibrio clariflavus]|nr:DUF1294 domain-containing protein [Acetivibrio clariflavus]HPU42188.1 DUF1294 domain-containing protein [Acetivibrio clariflavus]